MSKIFPGVTHGIVRTVQNTDDMKAMNGIMAFVDLCFGPGDNHAIKFIAIKKMEGPVTGLTAHIPKTVLIKDGTKTYAPLLEGKPADEAKMLALVAFDKVKSAYGLKFNKTYRVLAKAVEEVHAETDAGVSQTSTV